MALVYEATVWLEGETWRIGPFNPTKFKTIKDYIAAVESAGNEIEKDEGLCKELRSKTRGKAYRLREGKKRKWLYVLLDRRRSTSGTAEKTDLLNIRTTSQERARWGRAAELDERTLASWVRRILNLACQTCAACSNFGLAEWSAGNPFPDEFWCVHYEKSIHNGELAKKCPAFRWRD